MKAGLHVALGAWFALTVLLFAVWATAVAANGWYHGDPGIWIALWAYHGSIRTVIGGIATAAWLD